MPAKKKTVSKPSPKEDTYEQRFDELLDLISLTNKNTEELYTKYKLINSLLQDLESKLNKIAGRMGL